MSSIVSGTAGVTFPDATTQASAGAPSNSPTFTGTVVLPSTTSIGDVSSTEISYLDGVTSAIQTQINAKAPTASPTFSGTVSDGSGKLRAIPQSGSDKTTSYSLATTDVGLFVGVGSGGSITIPDATFSAGDAIIVFNNTSGNITITCSITTAYIGGTDADKASVTLATRGVANILFISGTVCVITGNVS